MRTGLVIALVGALGVVESSSAQSGTYHSPGFSPVGQLQEIGLVGRSDVDYSLGRIGGRYTGRFEPRKRESYFGSSDYQDTLMRRSVYGQDQRLLSLTRSQRESMLRQKPRDTAEHRYRGAWREQLGTSASNRELTFLTRLDTLRTELPDRVRFTGPLNEKRQEELEELESPIRKLLNRQNTVRIRSPLGRLTTQSVGRSAAFIGELRLDAYPAPPVLDDAALLNPYTTDNPIRLPEILAAGLEEEAARYFRLGVAYFAEANYVRAWDCFDICSGLEPDHARPRAAMVLTAHVRKDYNLSAINLHRALARAVHADDKAFHLEDLVLDVEALYGRRETFARVVHELNVNANRAGAEPSGDAFSLLAYFAWLNQDVRMAIAAARTAEAHLPTDERDGVRNFRESLMSQPG